MKKIFFLSVLCLLYADFGRTEVVGSRYIPDPGVSEEYLVSLGTAAVPFLLERLRNPDNERYYEGLIYYLKKEAIKNLPNEKIFLGLKDFIETNTKRQEIPSKTLFCMHQVMEAMGYIGGEKGVEFLSEWFEKDEFHGVTSHGPEGRTAEYTQDLLKRASARGLGRSDHPRARQLLNKLKSAPPKTMYRENFRIAVEEGLKDNSEIQQKGIKRYFEEHDSQRPQKHKKGEPTP